MVVAHDVPAAATGSTTISAASALRIDHWPWRTSIRNGSPSGAIVTTRTVTPGTSPISSRRRRNARAPATVADPGRVPERDLGERRWHPRVVPFLKIVFKLKLCRTDAMCARSHDSPGTVAFHRRDATFVIPRMEYLADLTAQPGIRADQGHLVAARHHAVVPRQGRGARGVRPQHPLGHVVIKIPAVVRLLRAFRRHAPAGQVLARQHLRARQLPLPVLRQEGADQRPHVRPRGTPLAGRADRVDQHRDVLLPVQPQEGRAHPARGRHAAARRTRPSPTGCPPWPSGSRSARCPRPGATTCTGPASSRTPARSARCGSCSSASATSAGRPPPKA